MLISFKLRKIYYNLWTKVMFMSFLFVEIWKKIQETNNRWSIQIRSFFWSVFPRIRTEYGEILYVYYTPYLSAFSPNVVKYGPEKIPYLDTFHVVKILYETHKTRKRKYERENYKLSTKVLFVKRVFYFICICCFCLSNKWFFIKFREYNPSLNFAKFEIERDFQGTRKLVRNGEMFETAKECFV